MSSVWIAVIVVAVVVFVCVGKSLGWCVASPWYAVRQRRQMLAELRRRDRGRR